jgi:NhaP-type Na+/H+ and K+/H+ antiporter
MVIVIAFTVMMLCLLLRGVLLIVMRRVRVVLAQQVEAVIVAIWRSHNGVDVEFGWLRIDQEHASVVVELNESHWALHPIIEWTILCKSTDPAKMRKD